MYSHLVNQKREQRRRFPSLSIIGAMLKLNALCHERIGTVDRAIESRERPIRKRRALVWACVTIKEAKEEERRKESPGDRRGRERSREKWKISLLPEPKASREREGLWSELRYSEGFPPPLRTQVTYECVSSSRMWVVHTHAWHFRWAIFSAMAFWLTTNTRCVWGWLTTVQIAWREREREMPLTRTAAVRER